MIVYLNARAPRLNYFSRSQSLCDWFRDCLCNRWLKKCLVQNLWNCPPLATKHTSVHLDLPIHISSSNNPAGPDFNQNLNITWPDVFPWAHVPLCPLLFFNYFPCLPVLDSLLSFVLFVPIFLFLINCCMCCWPWLLAFLSSISYSSLQPTPGSFIIWFYQSLLTKTSRISVHIHLSSSFSSPSPHKLLLMPVLIAPSNFLPPYPVQPVTPLLRSIIMAQLT